MKDRRFSIYHLTFLIFHLAFKHRTKSKNEKCQMIYGKSQGLSYFRVLRTFSGLTSLQLRSTPCSNSAFNSATVCIFKFGSSMDSWAVDARLAARLAASNPSLNKSWS